MKNIDEYIMGPRFNHGKRDEITTHSDPSNNIVLCLSEKKYDSSIVPTITIYYSLTKFPQNIS